MTVAKSTAIVRVKRIRKVMVALDMDSASTDSALARTDGVVSTATLSALDTVDSAAVTESALTEFATATPLGLAMLVIFRPVCMTAHNTDTATTELASARRDTVVAIALFPLSPSLASVLFIVFVVASSSVPRFMRPRELVLLTSATPSVPRSVFLNASLVRCL